MRTPVALVIVILAGCGSSKSASELHAVGTYIGGGSIFGADDCEYSGGPGVFVESSKPEKGPRFVRGPGRITIKCPKVTQEVTAVEATAAKISGPSKVKLGTKAELFSAALHAEGRQLSGEARIEWSLGTDCQNVATFGPVLGAQDTGGRDRTRDLVTTGRGKCTITVLLTTGSQLEETFPAKAWQDSKLVTIE